MQKENDYIPHKEAELVDWGENFVSQIGGNAGNWDIPAAKANALQANFAEFKDLHEQASGPNHTPVIIAEKNTAKDKFIQNVRAMARYYLQNPVITDAQRIGLGLHVRDTNPTHIPAPTTRPRFSFKINGIRQVTIVFEDEGGQKAKPYGVNGAVIFYVIQDEEPKDISEFTHSVLATHSPHTIPSTEADRGKTIHVVMCWQSETGERGPFSDIQSTIIP